MRYFAALMLALTLLTAGIPRAFCLEPDPGQELARDLDPSAGLPSSAEEQLDPFDPQNPPDLLPELGRLLVGTLSDLDLLGLRSALRVMGLLLCTVLLTGLGEAGRAPEGAVSAVGCLVVLGAGMTALDQTLRLATETVSRIHEYFRLLLPSMAGLLYASGGTGTSAALTSGALLIFDLLLAGFSGLLSPLLYLQLGLAGAEAVLGLGNLEKLRELVKWAAGGLLKGSLWIFSAVLTGTGLFSGAVDAHKLKAVRMAVSGMVPVVGGLVSEASGSILNAAGLLKTSVGLYGMLAVLAISLGPFLRIWIQYAALRLTVGLGGLLGTGPALRLTERLTEVTGMALAAAGIASILALLSLTLCVGAVTG